MIRRATLALGNLFFRVRDALFPLVFLAVVLADRPRFLLGSPAWDRMLDALGIVVALSGQAVRVLVIGLAYIRRGGLDRKIHADRLVREGIFAHSRNPLYLGNLLAMVGLCLVHNSWLVYLVAMPFFLYAYLAIVLAEEQFLGSKFGPEYEAYRREVPRFRLRLRGLGATIRSMRFDYRRVLRKEYGSTFSGVTILLGLLVWDDFQLRGDEAGARTLDVALWIWAPVVVFYLVVRWFKKTGRLGAGWAETSGAEG